MSPISTIKHFMHPEHPLEEFESPTEFRCGGCMIIGTGRRFRCGRCGFDLHQHCATCPETLSSLLHPAHPLSLVLRKPRGERQVGRICNVCSGEVEGLFYRCKACEFDVHPGCTRLPEQVNHAMHPQHPLALTVLPSGSDGSCLVCRGTCTGCRYRCNLCQVDIHFPCLLVPCQHPTSSSREGPNPPLNRRPAPSTYHPMNPYHYYNPPYMTHVGAGYHPMNPYNYCNPQYTTGYVGAGYHPMNPYNYCNPQYTTGYVGAGSGPFPNPGTIDRGNHIHVPKMMYEVVGWLAKAAISDMLFGGLDFSFLFS